MGKTKRRILIAMVGLPVFVIAITLVVGALLPEHHTATSSCRFQQTPETLWSVISDFENMPSWRPELREVKRLPDGEHGPIWVEVSAQGEIPYEIVEFTPPERMVTRIAGLDMPFGGTWTYEISASDGGSELTLTEDGEIYNAMFRFMARFVFGHHSTMDGYLTRLGERFGEEAKPAHKDASG